MRPCVCRGGGGVQAIPPSAHCLLPLCSLPPSPRPRTFLLQAPLACWAAGRCSPATSPPRQSLSPPPPPRRCAVLLWEGGEGLTPRPALPCHGYPAACVLFADSPCCPLERCYRQALCLIAYASQLCSAAAAAVSPCAAPCVAGGRGGRGRLPRHRRQAHGRPGHQRGRALWRRGVCSGPAGCPGVGGWGGGGGGVRVMEGWRLLR